MERNYPTGIKFRIFQAAVLSLSLLLASVSVAGCLLGDLAQEFPDASPALLQSFVTFPTIGGMIANIIGGASAAKIGKKNLCLVGIALCFVGAFSPMFIPSLIGKIAVRVLAGIGVGLIQPLSASLIVDCFEGSVANVMMGSSLPWLVWVRRFFPTPWPESWFMTGIMLTVLICMRLPFLYWFCSVSRHS